MKKLLTEFIGTFFLVFTICLSVGMAGPVPALAIGASLMVMVYMGGHISGGHYNPAVSLGAMLRGALPRGELLGYWAAQLLGGTAAAYVAAHVMGQALEFGPAEGVSPLMALVVEILYAFALVLVVLNVATSKKTEGNSYYGLAIGFTVVAGAMGGGRVSGGAFNPAVGTGLLAVASLSGGSLANLWIYWVGPLIGGALAAYVFKFQEGEG